MKIWMISALIFGTAMISLLLTFIGVKDKASEIFTVYESKVMDIENVHNTTWKTISGLSQVVKINRTDYDKYLKGFVERGQAYEGAEWVWIQENLIQKDPSIELKLIRNIEDGYKQLEIANREANNAAANFNAFRRKTFNSLMLYFTKYGNDVQYKQITSSRSKQALKDGEDNDTSMDLGD